MRAILGAGSLTLNLIGVLYLKGKSPQESIKQPVPVSLCHITDAPEPVAENSSHRLMLARGRQFPSQVAI